MLKGRKGLYILLPVVALIWGAIIYRVVDAFSSKEEEVMRMATIKPVKLQSLEREKFVIGTVERDPFLGTIYKPVVKKVVKATQPPKKKDTLIWPSIQYKGLVTDNAAGNAVYLITVNGMAQLLKKKQQIGDVTLLRGDKKAVILRYKGKQKKFTLAN